MLTTERIQHLDEVKTLVRDVGLRTARAAERVLSGSYPLERHPARARCVLEELMEERD